jgi:dolichol-phosphate mannosyltransferase
MQNLLSILIPARDEEKNIKIIVNDIITNISHSNYEIVFVNDFSSDNTEKILIELKSLNNKITYINNIKKGLGGAIDIGIKKSKGEYICIMMADSSDTVEDLNTYYNLIKLNNLDAVFGSRFIKDGKTVNYPLFKLILNRIGNLFTKFLIRSNYNDFTNGFKIYRRDVLIKLYPIISDNFNIFLELPLKLIIRGFKYEIIPISYYNRTVGMAKFRINELSLKYLFTLFNCFFEKIFLKKKK